MSKVTLAGRKPGPAAGVLLKVWLKRWAWLAVVLLHTVGLVGLSFPAYRNLFLSLTPLHLLLTACLLFSQDSHTLRRKLLYIVLASSIAFLLEVLGVSGSWLFGHYGYGIVLGTSVWEVPLLIGLNWAMLGYCAAGFMAQTSWPIWQKVALSSILLVGMDACMEPAAIGLGFWHWPAGFVPGQNYLGWWLTAVPACALRLYLLPNASNLLGPIVWWCQFLFFFILSWWVFPSL